MKQLITSLLIVFGLLNFSFGQYAVNFDGASDGTSASAYGFTGHNLNGITWEGVQAIIPTPPLANDWFNGTRSLRMRGYSTSIVEMSQNKANGIGTISFNHQRYGTDGQVSWLVDYSIDNGANWINIGSFTSGATVSSFSSTVNVNGNIRVRIRHNTGGNTSTNRRMNIDDLLITDYVVSCTPPTNQATNFGTSGISFNDGTVSWTRGNGNNVLVVAREGAAPTSGPISGTAYTANATYGNGDALGGGFVVYNGTGNSVSLTGLSAGTTYHIAIYEYNNTGVCYLSPALTGNFTTIAISNTSDIISSGGESATIPSSNVLAAPLTSTQGLQVWQFTIRDGGGVNDADNLPTILTDFTITQNAGNAMNDWANAIQSVDIFDGATHLATGVVTANTISFSGLNIVAPDNGSKTISMRLSLNCPATGNGNLNGDDFVFQISQGNVTEAGTGSSLFASFPITSSTNGQNVFSLVSSPITSITPTSGPSNTVVTINATGGGFTGSTAVAFNGTSATSFTVISDTQIEAIVPPGASTGDVTVTNGNCAESAYSSFTIIDKQTASCEGTVIFDDIVMSEIYDNSSGNLGYIEIYNGTGATVDLTEYSIDRYGDIANPTLDHTYTFPAVGVGSSIADGQVLVGRISGSASAVEDFVFGNLTGFNANDRLELMKGATLVDDFHETQVGSAGYVYRRNTTITNHNPIFDINEWSLAAVDDQSDLGNFVVSSGSEPNVTTHPTTSQLCNNGSTSLSVAGSEGFVGGLGLAYQWYVSAPNAAGWTAVTNSGVYSGATSTTLDISNITGLDGYQYYCQIRENAATCYSATNAVQLDVFGVGGTAGLWRGTTSTDWCNCFNWDDGTIPTNATNVVINQTASNNCVVGVGCGTAVANTVTISSNNGSNRLLNINNNGILNITGNLTISKTAGAGTLTVETTGNGNLVVNGNTTITGSGGTNNAFLRNQSATALLDLNGNLTISTRGVLDLNANGNLNLAGDFTNNNSAAAFDEANSRVIFDGNTNQSINTNAFTEIFHDITVNKSGGTLTLQDPITLDALGNLVLTNGQIVLNGLELSLNNPATTAITRTTGSIIDESGAASGNNSGKISWNMGTTTGAHVFPFASGVGGTYIPFTFNLTAGSVGVVSLSTYHTPASNLPWPSSPELVTNLASQSNLTPDNRDATADRFWQIDKTGASGTANLTFSYLTSELPVTPYNDPNTMIAQRYNSTLNQWVDQILPGQTTGTISGGYTVTVPNVTTFSPWTLANLASPLPAELVYFDATPDGNKVLLNWETASEINVSHFVIERSKDGVHFNPILTQEGAGNSSSTIIYNTIDYQPLSGVSYYRLVTYDYDGSFKISSVKTVNFENNTIGVFYDEENWVLNYKTESKSFKVDIVNALGAIVYSDVLDANENGIHISKSNMASGMYFIILHDGMQTQSIKVFK